MLSSHRVNKFLIVPEKEKHPFGGYRIRWRVFHEYKPVPVFFEDDLASKKIAAIHLVESGLTTQVEASEIVGLHRNTVSEAVRTAKLIGMKAAIEDDRGCKRAFHYTPEMKDHIIRLLIAHPDWTDSQIAEQAAADLNKSVSRQAVARFRIEHYEPFNSFDPPTKEELMKIEMTVRKIEDHVQKNLQMELNFDDEPELKAKVEEFKAEPLPDTVIETEKETISKLENGMATPYAGLYMLNQMLCELQLCELLGGINMNGKRYTSVEIGASLIFGLMHGLESIEAHKLLNPSQFGPLLGLSRSPDPITLRSGIDVMAATGMADVLIDRFALRAMRIGAVDPTVFFVDGHFLPYYGLSLLTKGYHTVRREVLKGNEIYVVSDISKKPLMFITEGCEIDFRPIIERIAERIIAYGVPRPLLVFDRGGYGIHFFKNISLSADFITWGKYVRNEELASISDKDFKVGFRFGGRCYEVAEVQKELIESAGTASKENRTERSKIEVRMIVIRKIDEKTDQEVGKRLPVLTSDTKRPGWEIGYFMLNRWGQSENFFKEIKSLFKFDYHPGYAIQEMEQQAMFDNPEVKVLKAAIKTLEKEIRVIEGERAIAQLEAQKQSDKKIENRIKKLDNQKNEKFTDLEGLKKKSEELPARVSLEYLLDKPMSYCDLEKKRIYDLFQIIAYHCRERLVDTFKECYKRENDVKQIVDKIIHKGGHIRLAGSTLIVVLDWIERPAHREAAIKLCQKLNGMGIMTQGRLPLRLHFAISRRPLTSA